MFALDILNQYQSLNGTLLAAGKLYIYKLGRSELATVYGDHNGEHTIPNPVVLDDQGMAEIYLNNAFDYTVVAYDAYGAEQFSRDIFPRRMGDGESIGTQLYEGVDPIVVNNDVYAISANTSRLGVVTPLYFVKDDEEETIIGFSGEAIIPSGTMNESAIGYEDGKITSYNGSAFSAGLNYSAGDNIVINGATIALDSAINLLDAQGAKAVSIDATEQQFTNLTSNNGSILDASGLYVSDLNMENAANLSKDGLYVTGTGSRISMSNDMSDIYGDNHFEIYGYQESGNGVSAMHLGGNDLIVQHGENRTLTATYSLTGACKSAQSALNIINSSDLTQYSAGANIDITDHVISGKDWSNEINDASANAYNQSTAWTDSQGYLTGVDLSEYAKTDFVVSSIDAATSGKYDTSSFSAISGSFLTAHQSLPESADWNGATTVVNNNSAIWNSTTNTVSSNSASWGASNPQIPVTGINGIKISESGDKVVFEVSGDYATEDWVTGQGYLTAETDWTNTITAASSYAYEQATAAIPAPFDPTYISGQIDSKLDSATYATDSGNFATTGDINDLVTSIAETYQPTAGMTAYQSAGDYYSASNPSGFITGVDLTPYQTTAGMTAYQPAGDYYSASNPSGFITGLPEEEEVEFEEIDLTDYQPVSAMTAYQSAGDYYSASNPSGFITGVPTSTMNESAIGYDANNKISSYNGSAFACGNTEYSGASGVLIESGIVSLDDPLYISAGSGIAFSQTGDNIVISVSGDYLTAIPAGTMNESAFSYDASDNITAYNGSAFKAGDEFPQSATEAIETVTANSADWNGTTETVSSNSGAWGGSALPISAGPGIKLAMVNNTLVASNDETVLWSGSKNTTAGIESLSESYMNFEKLGLYLTFDNSNTPQRAQNITTYYIANHGEGQPLYIYATANNIAANTLTAETMYISGSSAGNSFSLLGGIRQVNSTVTTGITAYNSYLKQIVGINRIAGV